MFVCLYVSVVYTNKQRCMLLWVNCASQKDVEVLSPLPPLLTYECNLIWKETLCRYNKVKMKPYSITMGPNPISLVFL